MTLLRPNEGLFGNFPCKREIGQLRLPCNTWNSQLILEIKREGKELFIPFLRSYLYANPRRASAAISDRYIFPWKYHICRVKLTLIDLN